MDAAYSIEPLVSELDLYEKLEQMSPAAVGIVIVDNVSNPDLADSRQRFREMLAQDK